MGLEPGNSPEFPFLLGGAFIEATVQRRGSSLEHHISLPSWRGFH